MSNKKQPFSIVSMFIALVAAMGVYNSFGNNKIIDYHNKFVKEAYNNILLGVWNPIIEKSQAGQLTDQQLGAELKAKFLPEVDKYIKIGETIEQPDFVKEYHVKLMTSLKEINKIAKASIEAIENEDPETSTAEFTKLNAAVHKMEPDYNELKNKMISEKYLEFQKEPSAK